MLSHGYWMFVAVVVITVLFALYACLRAEGRQNRAEDEAYARRLADEQAKQIALAYPEVDWDRMLIELEWQQLVECVEEARRDFLA